MTKKLVLLCFSIFILAACQQESMIKLSEENQQLVESKKLALEGGAIEDESVDDSAELVLGSSAELEESEETQETEETSLAETSENNESALDETEAEVVFDTSQWTPAQGQVQLTLTDYLPHAAYQIKEYTQADDKLITYPTYIDTTQSLMQVETRDNGNVSVDFYNWGTSQIVLLRSETDLNPYINHLSTAVSQSAANTNEVILQTPLQAGSSWQRNSTQTSEITAIYETAQLSAGDFTNVIEITTTGTDNVQFVEYYGEGEGLLAMAEGESVTQLANNYHENRIIHPINILLPSTETGSGLTEESQTNFKWQTNASLASAFDELFKELDIIDDTITVQNITAADGVVTIDFSPGVVAVLNAYPASEQSVIAAIVGTLGAFFNEGQVRITVNGNGMLPNTVPYPENGIYQVADINELAPEVPTSPEEADDAIDNDIQSDAAEVSEE